MRILIVDSNLAYSGMVREVMGKYAVGIVIDEASNASILRDRLAKNAYNFIFADVDSMFSCEDVATQLQLAHDLAHSQVIAWTSLGSRLTTTQDKLHAARTIQKPQSFEDINSLVRPLVGSDPAMRAVVAHAT